MMLIDNALMTEVAIIPNTILFSLQGCIDLLPAQTSGYSARNFCRRYKM
jgi:hypothetical protein